MGTLWQEAPLLLVRQAVRTSGCSNSIRTGSCIWQRTFGGANDDEANSVQQTSDGGYIVAGNTSSFGLRAQDAWILKLNATGIPLWQKTYGGSLSDEANSIQQTSDGGYIVAGSTTSFGSGFSFAWVLKLDANGVLEWQKQYGHGDGDVASSIQQTSDGGFIVAGYSYLFVLPQRLNDAWVFKVDENGASPLGKGLRWERQRLCQLRPARLPTEDTS